MDKKTLKLSINDKVYTITTSENVDQFDLAAKKVDTIFRDIASKTQFKNEGKVAILTALQLAFDLVKKDASEEGLETKLEAMVSLLDKELLV